MGCFVALDEMSNSMKTLQIQLRPAGWFVNKSRIPSNKMYDFHEVEVQEGMGSNMYTDQISGDRVSRSVLV